MDDFFFVEDLTKVYTIYAKFQPAPEKTLKNGFVTKEIKGTLEFLRGMYVAHKDLILKNKVNSIHRFRVIEKETAKGIFLNKENVYNSSEMGYVSTLLDVVDSEDQFIVYEKSKKLVRKNKQIYDNLIILNGNHIYQFRSMADFSNGYNTFMELLGFPNRFSRYGANAMGGADAMGGTVTLTTPIKNVKKSEHKMITRAKKAVAGKK